MSIQPKYGHITVHRNCAGLAYMRFLEVCQDEPNKFIGRIIDPQTMRVIRYTQEDVDSKRCIPAALGMPVMGWGYLDNIKYSGPVAGARKFWNSVHYGDQINRGTEVKK